MRKVFLCKKTSLIYLKSKIELLLAAKEIEKKDFDKLVFVGELEKAMEVLPDFYGK